MMSKQPINKTQAVYKIKLYLLDTAGQWEDQGLGQVTTHYASGALTLTVRSFDGGTVLFQVRLFKFDSDNRPFSQRANRIRSYSTKSFEMASTIVRVTPSSLGQWTTRRSPSAFRCEDDISSESSPNAHEMRSFKTRVVFISTPARSPSK